MAVNHYDETDEGAIPVTLRDFLRRRSFEVLGVFGLAAIIGLGLALASWSVSDPSLNHATAAKAHNWLGLAGSIIADQLMQYLGLGVLFLLLVPLVWVLRFFRHKPMQNLRSTIPCWIGSAVAFSCLISNFSVPGSWPLAGGLGGNVGDVISGGLMSILSIGIKGFVARVIVLCLTLGATLWTLKKATQFAIGERSLQRRSQKKKTVVATPSFVSKLMTAALSLQVFKAKPGSAARRTSSVPRTSDDVFSRFAPISLKQRIPKNAERIEPNFAGDCPTQELDAEGQADEINYSADSINEFQMAEGLETESDIQKFASKPVSSARVKPRKTRFELPSLELLGEPKKANRLPEFAPELLEDNARRLEGVLEDFGVRGQIINVRPGPVVTLYELEPAPGIKSSRVISLADDIARSMSAISARVAVVAGRNVIGIELPNPKRETVYLRELMQTESFIKNNTTLALALGKNIGGEPIFADLARMPHLLIAGTTGSGKSVGINTMILSLLYRLPPDKCKLIMIDPKMLELSVYEGIPHLLAPVVTDPRKAVVALKWAVREMEDRYKKMSKTGVRNVDGYNAKLAQMAAKGEKLSRTVQTGFDPESGKPIFEQEDLDLSPMPYIVVIIDEMADLMMVAGKDIEGAVQRLAQMARAAGIHVVMATQRPSVDVITGTIKANFPTRISFQVTSKIDSRTILGEQGAEQLLGQGDMLYMAGGGRISRLHAPFVTDSEVEEIVNHLKSQGTPEYVEAVTEESEEEPYSEAGGGGTGFEGGSGDELYDQAVAVVLRDRKVSTSYVQRRLQVGYNKAASLIERMEKEGLISSANATGKREILVPGEGAHA